MSRIGNRVLNIPEGVTVTNEENVITVKGPKGELSMGLNPKIEVSIEGNEIKVTRNSEIKFIKSMHGTTNSLIENMIKGVTEGYEKVLEINGVGYRFIMKGNQVEVNAGYSHKVLRDVPSGLTAEVNKDGDLVIKGIDKEAIGKFAAEIRDIRKPEPYKGKGIRYKGEHVRRKEGKKASK
jgi:large subunit ribosomal protein L6